MAAGQWLVRTVEKELTLNAVMGDAKMLHCLPFQSYSHSLRLTLIVMYFHQKFQKGSAKAA